MLRWLSKAQATAGQSVAAPSGVDGTDLGADVAAGTTGSAEAEPAAPVAAPPAAPDTASATSPAALAAAEPEAWKALVRDQRARRGLLLILVVALSVLWLYKPWRHHTAGASSLDYLAYTLGGADAGDELPLVVALHGLGDSPEGFVLAYRGLDVPARLVLPAGPQRYLIGRTWYALNGATADPDIAATVARLAAFLEQLQEDWPTRGKPIVTGFSQGGILSFQLAADHPAALGAVLPVSGGLTRPPADGVELPPSLPIRAFHGAEDTKVGADWAEASVAGLRERGADATLLTFDGVGHAVIGELRRAYHQALREAIEAAR